MTAFWPYDFDRPRGIFTPRDRRFLAGALDDELTDNDQRQKRYQLRQRLIHAIQDLSYLQSMRTDDLMKIVDSIEEMCGREADPSKESVAADRMQRRERIQDASAEVIALFENIHPDGFFQWMIGIQLATQAALDYYDKTGKYGVFEPKVGVERVDEMPISQLQQIPLDELNQVGEYYGWSEVLGRHGIKHLGWQPDSPNESSQPKIQHRNVKHPDLVEKVADVIKSLDRSRQSTDYRTVAETLADRENITEETANEAIHDARVSQRCYVGKYGELRPV